VDTYTRAFGEVPGFVKSKCFAPRRVTFAMIPSLHKALDKGGYELLRDAQGVIQDECHRAGGDQALHLLSLCTNATRWYGLSATPYDRADGTGFLVEGAFGPELCEVTQDDLIDAGRTVPAEVRVVPYYHPPYGFNDRTQWKTIQDRAITRNEARNSVLEEIGLVAAKPAIAFVSRKEHGHELTARLRERGMEVSYVDGTAPVCMRQDDANMLAKGRLDLIISTTVFAEGVNIPKLASVIICGGTKATTTIIQELGRGTRVTDGKDSFEVWDIADIGCGALEGQSNTRVRMYRKTGYPVHTVALEHGTVRVVRSRGKL
jgi:superfamily II DNA or RNA helicase